VTNSSPSIRLTSLLARSKGIVWFFLLLNVALYFFRPLSFPDVWWQWDDGRRIVHHATPAPHLTFGDPAVKFTDEYAVFESVLYLTAAAGGFGLLAVGYWVATTAPFWAAAMIAFRRSRQTGALAFALMAVCLILAGYIQQRPAVVGNLFLFMLAIGLLRPENFLRRGAGMIALGILFCLWSDTHSSYVIGLGTLGLFLAERVFREGRKSLPPALLLLGLAVLATALHPDGFGRWVFTLDQYRDRWGYVISSEMGPPSLPFQALIVAGFCLGLYLYFQSRQQVWWWLAVTTVMTLMSLSSYRFSNHLAALLLVSLAFHGRAAAEEGPPARTIAMIGGNCLLSTFLIVAALAELFLILPMGQRKQPWIGPAVSSTELIDQLGGHLDRGEELVDDLLDGRALDFRFRLADEAVAQDRVGEFLDVVGRDERALAQRGQHARGLDPAAAGARTRPERQLRALPRGGEQAQGVIVDGLVDGDRLDFAPDGGEVGGGGRGLDEFFDRAEKGLLAGAGSFRRRASGNRP
jgi:hypothetical protein